jgi:hypothetical protein
LLSAPTDIAWEHSRFGWADLLIDGIFIPVHHGQAVSYRPPRWDEHGREGSIEVPAGCPLLIIEGDGARRREAAHLINTLIWVQADERVLDVISAQRRDDPARGRTERADDDRAAAGRKAGSDRQRPYSGAVQERHPGQVQDKPLDPVVKDACRMLHELARRQKVERAAQDERADRSVADGLDRKIINVHGFSMGSRGLDDTN